MNPEEQHLGLAKEYLRSKYSSIHIIMSPPRCSSTALARLFWELESVRYYAHEPFETTYYEHASIDDAIQYIDRPLDLRDLYEHQKSEQAKGLVIKEMPYQVNSNFEFLANLTQFPLVFLIRDPRLNIYSRIQKKLEAGSNPIFPLIETGWELLIKQIQYCRDTGIDFTIVKSDDFRNNTDEFTHSLMDRVGLSYSPKLLNWHSADQIPLDNLNGVHSHLYRKVLSSSCVLPATEPIPAIQEFPSEGGIRDHVVRAMDIFEEISQMRELLTIKSS